MPGGEEDEVRLGAGVVNYIEVCVHLDQSQYDKAGEGGRHSHKKYSSLMLVQIFLNCIVLETPFTDTNININI